jgi:hypothetical protein
MKNRLLALAAIAEAATGLALLRMVVRISR